MDQWNGVEKRSTQEGVNLLNVHDTANRALFTIEFHAAECDKRQLRIESGMVETRGLIERANAAIRTAQESLYEKIENQAEDFNVRIDKTNDKVDALALKIAGVTGLIVGLREVIAYAVHHFSP